MSGRRATGIGAFAVMLGGVSCSLLMDADVAQCATTADCVGRGAALATTVCVAGRCVAPQQSSAPTTPVDASATEPSGPWRCIGKVTWAERVEEPIVGTHYFEGFLDHQPAVGLSVDLCNPSDTLCATPLMTVTTDEHGKATIPSQKGFKGYLNIVRPSLSMPDLMPAVDYILPPRYSDYEFRTPVLSRNTIDTIATFAGIKLDPNAGMIFAFNGDCDLRMASGVRLALEGDLASVPPIYFHEGLPTSRGTETDPSGLVGFVGVPPGIVTLTATVAATGKVIARHSVIVRPRVMTQLFVTPSPH